jgi:hypothetical protein
MARNLLPLLCALALASPSPLPSQVKQAQSSPSLVGTWSATVNWNLPSGLMITTSFTADGRIQSTTQNHQGMSFMLSGVYQFNAAQGTLSYKWQDFSPKQICVGGNCSPAPAPAPMGVVTTNKIRFQSPTQFVATSSNASTTYIRTNGAGFPTP